MEDTLDLSQSNGVAHNRYRTVNEKWPECVPQLTSELAKRAFRVLYRHRLGSNWKNKVIAVKGRRRRTWTRAGAMIVAPDQGWRGFIHDLSHWLHRRQFPQQLPHRGSAHAAVEMDLIEQVVRRGWLQELPRVKPNRTRTPTDLKRERYDRVLLGIQRWKAKEKRAQNALQKLTKRKLYYERVLSI